MLLRDILALAGNKGAISACRAFLSPFAEIRASPHLFVSLLVESCQGDAARAYAKLPRGHALDAETQKALSSRAGLFGTDVGESLRIAASRGDEEIVLKCIAAAPVSRHHPKYARALYYAAAEGRVEVTRLLMGAGAQAYPSALEWAAAKGHLEVARVLLDAGVRSRRGQCWAASAGHFDVVDVMLRAGVRCIKSLCCAASAGHGDIVKLLLRAGVRGRVAALEGAAYGKHVHVVRILLGAGFWSRAALSVAAQAGDGSLEIVRALLDAGIRSKEALKYAVMYGYVGITRALLESGIRDDALLITAAARGDAQIVQLLLDAGMCCCARRALSVAVERGHAEIARRIERSRSARNVSQ